MQNFLTGEFTMANVKSLMLVLMQKKSSEESFASAVSINWRDLARSEKTRILVGDREMLGTTASTATFVGSPTVDLQPAADPLPKVDLHHVAYFRDDTSYEDLLKTLLQKVSMMQKNLAMLSDR